MMATLDRISAWDNTTRRDNDATLFATLPTHTAAVAVLHATHTTCNDGAETPQKAVNWQRVGVVLFIVRVMVRVVVGWQQAVRSWSGALDG